MSEQQNTFNGPIAFYIHSMGNNNNNNTNNNNILVMSEQQNKYK